MTEKNIAEFVVNTINFIKKKEKIITKISNKNKNVQLIKQKISDIEKKLERIANNHNLIKTVNFYWRMKKQHMYKNIRVKILNKEWMETKKNLTKEYFSKNEKDFNIYYPNKMQEYIKFEKPCDLNIFHKKLESTFNINVKKNIDDYTLEQLCNESNIKEYIKINNLDNQFIESIPIDLNNIFESFPEDEKKILNNLFIH